MTNGLTSAHGDRPATVGRPGAACAYRVESR